MVEAKRPVALITGARRGIGHATAALFAAEGFDVAVADIEAGDDLLATAAHCRAAGARAESFAFDLAAIETHDAVIARVEQALGAIDCLVNNAGVSVLARGDLLDVGPESFDRCFAVNTRGTFFLTQAVAKRMLVRAAPLHHRAIVTVTSSNAVAASVQRGEYCVSKAGSSMATTLFALRLADQGIGVYELQPGLIETEMTAPSKARYDGLIENGGTAIRRWGQPGDVARIALTAAEGRLPYTVGLPIRIDGGLLIPKF